MSVSYKSLSWQDVVEMSRPGITMLAYCLHLSVQIIDAESEYITLAEISLETELRIHEVTILLLRFQALKIKALSTLGGEIDPSTKPSLFLAKSAINIALLHGA